MGTQIVSIVSVDQGEAAKTLPEMGNGTPKPPILKGSNFILQPKNLGRKLPNAKFICRENKGLGSCLYLLICPSEGILWPWFREEQKAGLHGIRDTKGVCCPENSRLGEIMQRAQRLSPLCGILKRQKKGELMDTEWKVVMPEAGEWGECGDVG